MQQRWQINTEAAKEIIQLNFNMRKRANPQEGWVDGCRWRRHVHARVRHTSTAARPLIRKREPEHVGATKVAIAAVS